MVAIQNSTRQCARIARLIQRRVGPLIDREVAVCCASPLWVAMESKALRLARIYCAGQARRIAATNCTNLEEEVSAAAARVREATAHALLADMAVGLNPDAAVNLLWERVRGRAGAVVRRFVPTLARSLGLTEDDLLQEAFLKFRQSLSAFDPERGPFGTFLDRVLSHRLLEFLRRGRLRTMLQTANDTPTDTSVGFDLNGLHARDGTDDAERAVSGAEVSAAVDDVCWRMMADGYPAEKLRAFRLRRLAGLRLEAVAFRLGRSVTWVFQADQATEREFACRFAAEYAGIVRDVTQTDCGGQFRFRTDHTRQDATRSQIA